ncbi:MAG: hypothetical protein AAF135_09165 [Bacteroidota bacterium]
MRKAGGYNYFEKNGERKKFTQECTNRSNNGTLTLAKEYPKANK